MRRNPMLNLTLATVGFMVNFWAWALLGPLGTGIKEFKKATREVTDEISSAMDEQPAQRRSLPQTSVESQPPAETHQQTVPQSPSSTQKA